jgi:glutaredoxin 3
MASKITLYTTDKCSSCLRAKALLIQRALPFEEINLSRDPDGREQLVQRTGMLTFPQVLIGEQTIGGFEALVAAERSGRLRALLAV